MGDNGFSSQAVGRSDIWEHAIDISDELSDDEDLAKWSRGFMVTGDDGAVKFTTVGGETMTLDCLAWFVVPYHVARVWSTGTDATGIVGGY